MKALVKYKEGFGNMEICEMPEPSPATGQVKIEIKEAGICGSDLHIYQGDTAFPMHFPVITGHEFSGVVLDIGEGVTKFKKGDRVVSEAVYSYCGNCEYCQRGFYNLCNDKKSLGYWYNGAFAKYTVVEERSIHKLPEEIDFLSGAMLEPLACCVHGVYDCCHIEEGDVVLVSGPGAIGLIAAQVAKAKGAKVIVSGTDADGERLRIAEKLGIDCGVNIQKENLVKVVNELTNNCGADAVLECSGTEAGVQSGLELVKKRGHFCQIGLTGKPITFDIETICYKEIHFSGSMGSRYCNWERGIELVKQGLVKLHPLVTHCFELENWKQAFQMFREKRGLKLILKSSN